ncbi:pyridoxal phosphate-dependent aminotransferase [bacterium CG17_big_fil_post_rev_8_21_14_2_50_64_8]|nr:MAG: pyridoxal phosphate-dependent aminotransferase [bacterium CG17_big_fil_post_rev_8_21_14_2_50_64_8]
MQFSQIAAAIAPSVTLKLNAQAARMRTAGEPVMHLGGGEPESLAPDAAVAAGIDMLQPGRIRYTPAAGTPAMRDAIVAYTARFYGREVARENVMASAGAKQAIMVALLALVDPGDEVVFPVPYWVSYPDMVRLAGGTPVPVEPPAGRYEPTIDQMQAALTERTRAILLNSPNNPSGMVLSEEFIRAMVTLCEQRGIALLMDDIYHRLVFDGGRAANVYDCTDRGIDESPIVVLNGVSKQYAMTGFRIGWAVGPQDLIQAMSSIQSHQSGGPCSLSQVAAVAALEGKQDSVAQLRADLELRRDEMVSLLRGIPGLKVNVPGGTFYCFCDCSAFDTDSVRLAAHIIEKVQVVTVPGAAFGMDGHLRLSFCGSVEDIREGVLRLRWLLDPDSPAELVAGDRTFRK